MRVCYQFYLKNLLLRKIHVCMNTRMILPLTHSFSINLTTIYISSYYNHSLLEFYPQHGGIIFNSFRVIWNIRYIYIYSADWSPVLMVIQDVLCPLSMNVVSTDETTKSKYQKRCKESILWLDLNWSWITINLCHKYNNINVATLMYQWLFRITWIKTQRGSVNKNRIASMVANSIDYQHLRENWYRRDIGVFV